MTQVKSAQENPRQVALRKRANARTLAQRRAAFAAQMRDMALSDLSQVSARLKRLHKELEEREGREWTQQQLAEKTGIPYRTFQSWENGEVENRDGKGYDKIARFYSRKLERKVTRKWIVFGDEDRKPERPNGDLLGQLDEADQLSRIERKLDSLLAWAEGRTAEEVEADLGPGEGQEPQPGEQPGG